MKFYLSSYKIGDQKDELVRLAAGRKIGFIPNSVDYMEPEKRDESNMRNLRDLADIGIDVETLDLKEYFGNPAELEKKLANLGGVWVRGGNTFVLRQAMKLSGFDNLIKHMHREDFMYGGYSAGVCVLAPSLKGLQIVDKPSVMPYTESTQIIWEGLGLLDYLILPHYKSNHPESADIDKEVDFCTHNRIPFKPLKDGEVIIIE